jgi:hypothetical protein
VDGRGGPTGELVSELTALPLGVDWGGGTPVVETIELPEGERTPVFEIIELPGGEGLPMGDEVSMTTVVV